jgi:serine/threonine-protein kinase SRK2
MGSPADKYEVMRKLGSGAFGEVVLARDKTTDEYVAIKKMERAHLNRQVEPEIMNHSELNHPHIVKLKEIFITPKHMNIVMECASNGSLFEYVSKHKRLHEAMAR